MRVRLPPPGLGYLHRLNIKGQFQKHRAGPPAPALGHLSEQGIGGKRLPQAEAALAHRGGHCHAIHLLNTQLPQTWRGEILHLHLPT